MAVSLFFISQKGSVPKIVTAELSLTFLACKMKYALNLLGAKVIIKRLRVRRVAVLGFGVFFIPIFFAFAP